jgi:hypothetical protein
MTSEVKVTGELIGDKAAGETTYKGSYPLAHSIFSRR